MTKRSWTDRRLPPDTPPSSPGRWYLVIAHWALVIVTLRRSHGLDNDAVPLDLDDLDARPRDDIAPLGDDIDILVTELDLAGRPQRRRRHADGPQQCRHALAAR